MINVMSERTGCFLNGWKNVMFKKNEAEVIEVQRNDTLFAIRVNIEKSLRVLCAVAL